MVNTSGSTKFVMVQIGDLFTVVSRFTSRVMYTNHGMFGQLIDGSEIDNYPSSMDIEHKFLKL